MTFVTVCYTVAIELNLSSCVRLLPCLADLIYELTFRLKSRLSLPIF
jgi:hypothetical protein